MQAIELKKEFQYELKKVLQYELKKEFQYELKKGPGTSPGQEFRICAAIVKNAVTFYKK